MLHDPLKDKIEFGMNLIQQELSATRDLFGKLALKAPDEIEIRAVAGTLHAFYNGVENVFLHIARHYDSFQPDTGQWHSSLLRSMTSVSSRRNRVISDQLSASLMRYLSFRHFYRHAYGFFLDWDQMKPLVNDLDAAWLALRDELESFIKSQ